MLRISQPRIISFVRLLGKLGIFRPLPEYCALRQIDLRWRRCRPQKRRPGLTSGILTKTRYENWHRDSGTGFPCAIKFLTLRGSFHFPAQLYSEYFLRLW
jgi:hypothetical protein